MKKTRQNWVFLSQNWNLLNLFPPVNHQHSITFFTPVLDVFFGIPILYFSSIFARYISTSTSTKFAENVYIQIYSTYLINLHKSYLIICYVRSCYINFYYFRIPNLRSSLVSLHFNGLKLNQLKYLFMFDKLLHVNFIDNLDQNWLIKFVLSHKYH